MFFTYFGLRSHGIYKDEVSTSNMALSVLSTAAVILFPRLVFVTLSNNVLILSIRVLVTEFVFLMAVGACCFTGFLYALWRLADGEYSIGVISTWMVEVFVRI